MIEFGGCDEDGYREIRLVSELDDAPEGTLIQWYIDGAPFGGPMLPGEYIAKVPGDGQVHYIELHIVGFEGGADAERVKFPSCERETVEADIRHVRFGDECDGEGNRPIQLVPQIAPAEAAENVIVQWYIDGQPVGQPGPPEPLVDSMPGDGAVHLVELRVLEPENGRGDSEQFEVPACDSESVQVSIKDVDFADCDEEGNRPLRVLPHLEPAGASDVVVQWYLDGKPVGQPGAPAALMTSVPGDGAVHQVEVRVLEPSSGTGDTDSFEIPVCEEVTVRALIKGYDFLECDNEGNRGIVLVPDIDPPSVDNPLVQWFIDGKPVGQPAAPDKVIAELPGDGNDHTIEIRLVSPEGTGETQTISVPACSDEQVRAHVESVKLGDCDEDGFRTVTFEPGITPADTEGVIVQWFVQGQPIGQPGPPATATGKVYADGKKQTVDLRVLEPEDAKDGTDHFRVPKCSDPVAEIVSVEVAEDCNDDRSRTVTLVSKVDGHDSPSVRWLLDGEEIVAIGPHGEATVDLTGNGKKQQLTLEVIEPSDLDPISQEIEIPLCTVHVDQSNAIYLQAAGSDGSDDTMAGAHLRWQLMGELGQTHIPQGTLGLGADNVKLVRYPYEPVPLEVASGDISGGVAEVLGEGGLRKVLLKNESGVQQISVENEAFFAIELNLAGSAEIEVISERTIERRHREPTDDGVKTEVTFHTEGLVILRQSASGTFTAQVDNGTAIRLRGASITSMKIETYSDFYASQRENEVELGEFGLSLDSGEVRSRVATPSAAAIENWPKFASSGIRVDNYMKRWDDADAGGGLSLRNAVEQYVQLSPTDPRALLTFPSDVEDDIHELEFSILDAINLNALDFHIARMLGLGAIDTEPKSASKSFLYCVVYSPPGAGVEERYFSLPTGVEDDRLPPAPTLKPATYGVSAPSLNGGLQLTDDNGYSKWTAQRYVNLFAKEMSVGPRLEDFYESADELDCTGVSSPVLMGIEYRGAGESSWRKPTLDDDDRGPSGFEGDEDFLDAAGDPEPIPVFPPLDPNSFRKADTGSIRHPRADVPLITHIEREEGVHEYAAYSINWFSRRSALSSPVATDATEFPHNCFIAPPAPIAAHLIQVEQPLVLTSQVEQQDRLDQLRVTFGWGPAQHKADPDADSVSFRWRTTPTKIVSGEIKAIDLDVGGHDECLVETATLQLASTGDADAKLVPAITPAEVLEFIGSHIATDSGSFEILEVITSGNGEEPSFRVKQQRTAEQSTAVGPNGGIHETFDPPTVGELFSISENLNLDASPNWTELGVKVPLIKPEGLHNPSANVRNTDPIKNDALAPAIYAVELPGTSLPPQSADVEWAGGYLECTLKPEASTQAGEAATLTVLRLADVNGTLTAVVQSSEDLVLGAQEATLFPGYRAYFTLSDLAISKSDLVPVAPDTLRTTYLSAYAANSTEGCSSDVSAPTQINAIRITNPVPPKQPAGSMWATPPDPHFGRATYTFDVEFETSDGGEARTPYGFVVERTTLRSVLSQLYTEDTVEDILELHRSPESSDFWANRWQNLVNLPDGATAFETLDGVALQAPDNPESPYVQPGMPNPGITPFNGSTFDAEQIRLAMEQAFVPVTEGPLLMEFVKQGEQTSSDAPVTTTASGKSLSPLDATFEPSPMARKLPGSGYKVRFTDYTLDGAATLDVFFYRVREISESQMLSAPSPAVGPVRLVNTKPPRPPLIVRSYLSKTTASASRSCPFSVTIAIATQSETPTELLLLRSFATSEVGLMDVVERVTPAVGSNEVKLTDEFVEWGSKIHSREAYYRVLSISSTVHGEGQSVPTAAVPVLLPLSAKLADTEPQVLNSEYLPHGYFAEIGTSEVLISGSYTLERHDGRTWVECDRASFLGGAPSDQLNLKAEILPLSTGDFQRVPFRVKFAGYGSVPAATEYSKTLILPEVRGELERLLSVGNKAKHPELETIQATVNAAIGASEVILRMYADLARETISGGPGELGGRAS